MTATSSFARKFTSSFARKTISALLVTGALAATSLVGASSAQAFPFHPHPHFHHHWGPGWGPGMGLGLAAGAIGAAVAYDAYAAPGYCHLERRFGPYGEYLGRVRVCE
jgi:drug/metabolite transporter (DMT)-like permease